MAKFRLERFMWLTTKGLHVDNSESKGEPLFGPPDEKKPVRSAHKLLPSQALAAITGNDPLPRSQVVSKVWEHIRKNNLQDPHNKREIVADSKLKKVFGGKDRVSMFELNKQLSRNLDEPTERLNRRGRSGRGSEGRKRA